MTTVSVDIGILEAVQPIAAAAIRPTLEEAFSRVEWHQLVNQAIEDLFRPRNAEFFQKPPRLATRLQGIVEYQVRELAGEHIREQLQNQRPAIEVALREMLIDSADQFVATLVQLAEVAFRENRVRLNFERP